MVLSMVYQRVNSSKRRIKTVLNQFQTKLGNKIRESIPAREGLRLQEQDCIGICISHQRVNSSKRRIKTSSAFMLHEFRVLLIRESIPAREGLRLCDVPSTVPLISIRESIPAREGLRHKEPKLNMRPDGNQRVNSSKRRIKT